MNATYANPQGSVATPAIFTPSELVLLHGQECADKGRIMDMVELLEPKVMVSASQLGMNMMAAALLINEQLGALRFEIRATKVLFVNREHLFAVPGQAPLNWPSNTLEDLIARKVWGGPVRVKDLAAKVLTGESNLPWELVAGVVKEGLANRGLVNVEKKGFAMFSRRVFGMSARVQAIAEQSAVGPIQQMIANCQEARPELWNRLADEMNDGVRTHYPEVDIADDN